MQRYRVNYGLLIGLCVGLVVIGVGGFFGLRWRLDRNAAQLLRRADEAIEAGDLRDAAGLLSRYNRQRPRDAAAAERMATNYLDILKLPDVEGEDYGNALVVTESVVRDHGEAMPELRQQLAELYVAFRRWIDALKHIDLLLNDDPKDPELQRLRATCLINAQESDKALAYLSKLVGYNRRSGGFDAETEALGPNTVEVYPLLARLIVADGEEPEAARVVIDRMVEANPEAATAHVMRAQYLLSSGEEADLEQADADLARARELEPKGAQVLLVSSLRKLRLEEYDAAREYLLTAKAEHPTNTAVYRSLSRLELAAKQDNALQRAIAELDEGIENAPKFAKASLMFEKADLQANVNDTEGLASSIDKLSGAAGIRTEQVDYLRARQAMLGRKWHDAAKLFKKIRPVVGTTAMGGPTNFMLGMCYQQLGQMDLALDAMTLARELQPNNTRAEIAIKRIKSRLNRNRSAPGDDLTGMVVEELQKPDDEQDWSAIDQEVERLVEERDLPPVMGDILRADIFIRREMPDRARRLVDKALDAAPDNQTVVGMAISLIARDPDRGPVEALKRFNELVSPDAYADSVTMRLLKADLLIAIDDEALAEQLFGLLDGTEGWGVARRVAMLKGLAIKFGQVRDTESRRRVLKQIAELSPGELPTLLDLFQTALAARDTAAISAAQQKILDVVQSKDDPTWLFTEATRLTSEAIAKQNDKVLLAEANDLVDRALGARPDWHLLHLTRADVAFAQGKRGAALSALDRARELGPMTTASLVRHVALLSQAGRFTDARKALESTPQAIRQRLLGRQYAEVLLNTGSVGEALDSATRVGEAGVDNAAVQLWLGRFLRRASAAPKASPEQQDLSRAKSVEALEAAVALAPESPEAWLELVLLHAAAADRLATEDALRRAQLRLPVDQSTIVLARGYELIGRFFDAENLYRAIEQRQPDNLGVKRQMAAFYLSPRYPREDSQLKATRLINQILLAAEDQPAGDARLGPTERARDGDIRWARRAAAELLSRTGDYQKLLTAERLLAGNARQGRLGREDQLLMAKLLAPRPEPLSRIKAIELLEGLKKLQPLAPDTAQTLGQLYFVTDDWEACRRQMTDVIAEAGDLPNPRAAYIRMLLRRDDSTSLNEAARQLKVLQELAPAAPGTVELIARVYQKFGKEDQVKRVLLPLITGKKTSTNTVFRVAALLAELGDTQSADKIYGRLAEQGPAAKLQYAAFLGEHVDPDQAFRMLDDLRNDVSLTQIVRVAMGIGRARREELGDAIDAKCQLWLDRALREDPESVDLLLLQAELFDLQKRFDEAVAIYERLLKGGEMTGRYRAVVLNNLAYLLALASDDASNAERAMGYVAEAVDILGPTADILDTRAVVFLAQGKPGDAIADLKLSLTDNPTASKHFHKSRAHLAARQIEDAVDEWDKAEGLGFRREDVSTIERDAYDQLARKVAEVRGEAVTP